MLDEKVLLNRAYKPFYKEAKYSFLFHSWIYLALALGAIWMPYICLPFHAVILALELFFNFRVPFFRYLKNGFLF